MDVSLDDYINTSNFKIQIGNPGFKGNKPQPVGGLQTGKKRFANTNPGNRVTDVSVTVPHVPKTVGKVNVTNQVRDARERLVSKPGPAVVDARQKISQKAGPADARQKLQNMRARKGPLDARAKIQAKKQQQHTVATATAPSTDPANFTLTRTVTNNSTTNIHVNRAGPSTDMQLTRTLTKVMPPGYEALVGDAPGPPPQAPPQPRPLGVKLRLGPPQQAQQCNIPTLTRTVANPNTQGQPPPMPPVQGPGQPPYDQYPQQLPPPPPQPQYQVLQTETRPIRIHAPVPQVYQHPPAPQRFPHYPQQAPPTIIQAPPPGAQVPAQLGHPVHQVGQDPPRSFVQVPIQPPVSQAPPHPNQAPPPQIVQDPPRNFVVPGAPPLVGQAPPTVSHDPPRKFVLPLGSQAPPPSSQAPPPVAQDPPPARNFVPIPRSQAPPSSYAPPPPDAPYEGPPYPVVEPVPVATQIPQQADAPLPRIQVQNDQYRPPPAQPHPPAAVPPYPTYPMPAPAPQPQYVYPPQPQHQTQPIYYPPTAPEPEPVIQRTVPNVNRSPRTSQSSSSSSALYRRESSDPYTREKSEDHGVKRKSAGGAAAAAGGPLKLSSTNTVPVLAVGERERRPQADRGASSYSRPAKEEPPVKKPREEIDENNVISPLQGYKIVITNLHVTVSQDDIIELFGAVGAVKKVKLVKPGTAEVVYVTREHAVEAAKTYHERELDGLPMVVKMVTPSSAKVREAPESLPPQSKPVATGPLKLSKKPAGMAKVSDKKGVEVDILHKALFKTGSTSSAKPVTFTVNI